MIQKEIKNIICTMVKQKSERLPLETHKRMKIGDLVLLISSYTAVKSDSDRKCSVSVDFQHC